VVSISLLLSLLGCITIVVAKANPNLFKSKAQRDISHA